MLVAIYSVLKMKFLRDKEYLRRLFFYFPACEGIQSKWYLGYTTSKYEFPLLERSKLVKVITLDNIYWDLSGSQQQLSSPK